MAPDDHTDYFWSGTDVEYKQAFVTMLDYYLDRPMRQRRTIELSKPVFY